jgi:ribosomal protein L11 methyltransferase
MENFIKIVIQTSSEEQSDIFVAELSEIKYYAFEEVGNQLSAYIKEADYNEKKLRNILPESTLFIKTLIKNENWNEQWESDFKPVIVNSFVAIRASFHEPVERVKYDLIITPKMSFGTGHHATTFLMISLMEKIDFKNKFVIDFGTGTGVLAILAEKLGASKVIAIDNDEWSINNATENIVANNCAGITVKKQDHIFGFPSADIILANINLNILNDSASSIAFALKSGGFLMVSGFLTTDEKSIENTFLQKQFVKKIVLQKTNWLGILFQKL